MTRNNVTLLGGMLVAAFVAGALSSAILPVRVGAQGSPAVITAEQINLITRSGRLRGIFSAEDETGAASVTLFDEMGQRRSALTVARDGTPALQLYDRAQAARVMATVEGDQPAIVVNGDAGVRAILGMQAGGPVLTFQDAQRIRAETGLSRGGAPRLGLFGPAGQPQMSLTVNERGEPVVALRDDAGRGRVSVGVVQGATVINLADQMTGRVVLGVAADGTASLSFLDAAGRVTDRMPK